MADRYSRFPNASTNRIFVSYRRADSGVWTENLASSLRSYFGEGSLFRDLDSMVAGQDFMTQLDSALDQSRVVLALIGPAWTTIRSQDGIRRIDDAQDVVVAELTRALQRDVPVIPVLVGGAQLPKEGELPRSLRSLTKRHALHLREGDWPHDLGVLVRQLESHGLVQRGVTESGREPPRVPSLTDRREYERTVNAARHSAFTAARGAVDMLGYRLIGESAGATEITFRALGRDVTLIVFDQSPGTSRLVLEFNSVRTAALGAAAVVSFGVGTVTWAAMRAWERRFARGYFDNVESVLGGHGVRTDSRRLPGVERMKSRFGKL